METVADAVWTVGLQAQEDSKSKGRHEALAEFVKMLVKEGGAEVQGVMERLLDTEMLEHAGIIASSELMERKLKKTNTDTVYRQQKYNLFREEVGNSTSCSLAKHFLTCFYGVWL